MSPLLLKGNTRNSGPSHQTSQDETSFCFVASQKQENTEKEACEVVFFLFFQDLFVVFLAISFLFFFFITSSFTLFPTFKKSTYTFDLW